MAMIQVIKFEGDPNALAWKFPNDELGTWTQLIVNESYEAVLFKGGKACDVFMAGRHTLETANIPVLNQIVNLPFGGESPFVAEVWYINKKYILDIKWGTPSPIQMQDPKYKVFLPIRSFGQFGIQVVDSRKFLIKTVGTLSEFTRDNLLKYFKGVYLTNVKDAISTYLLKQNVSALEINAYLIELSEHIKERMAPIFDEYGIQLVNFYVNDINIPEDDSSVIKLKAALAKKAEMDIVGYNYAQERSFDTLQDAASNPGSTQAGLMGAGLGLGMGVGMGGAFGSGMNNITNVMNTSNYKKCLKCGAEMEMDKRFCSTCGFDSVSTPIEPQRNESAQLISCAECGAGYPKTTKFCPECGNSYKPCPSCGADLLENGTECQVCGIALPKPCPKCSTLISGENVKFCPECGESLINKCLSCQTVIEGSPKFCPECGQKL